jgi:hypothetical protein
MTEDGVDEAAHSLLGERRACHQSAKEDRAEERESRKFRIELPLAIPTSERLLIAVGHSKAAIPLSTSTCHSVASPERRKGVDSVEKVLTRPTQQHSKICRTSNSRR